MKGRTVLMIEANCTQDLQRHFLPWPGLLSSKKEKNSKGLNDFRLEVKTIIWPDCLICAKFARERYRHHWVEP